MGQNENNSFFTFAIENGMPKITIDGNKLAVVECEYYWSTSTESSQGESYANVTGYIDGELEVQVFQLDFKTNKVWRKLNGTK